jgi:hypothetical protein
MGCKIMGSATPIPPENKNAPENNRPVIEARRKFELLSHIPMYMKKNIRNDGIDRLPIVVHAYGERAFCGKYIKLKFDDVRLENAFPKVVVGRGVIIGVGVIVMYGGEDAFATSTRPSAHINETIYFFKFNIYQSLPVL